MNALVLLTQAAVLAAAAATNPLVFERQRIGDVIYEAASAFDVDKDGDLDIVSGEYWFEGPDFKTAHKACDVMPVDDYYDDFSCKPMDVNGDGYLDVVTGGYWGCILRWRENPKGKPGPWPVHDIAEVGNIERACFYDLDGDKVPEVIPVTKPVHIFKLKPGGFDQFTIPKGGGGHGFGCGDINGDQRPDLLFAGGWLEAPKDTWDVDAWQWHPEFKLGSASVPILVFDVNGDGLNDLIVGEAHNYGLYWLEQGKDGAKRTWEKHMIEEHRSQFHDLQLHDIDNDGAVELLTGKRYRAHNGHDPGSADPLGLYYYEINGGDFERITIDYGPPDRASGAGIYFWVADVDENGWQDIVAPGKEGLYLFRNMGPAK